MIPTLKLSETMCLYHLLYNTQVFETTDRYYWLSIEQLFSNNIPSDVVPHPDTTEGSFCAAARDARAMGDAHVDERSAPATTAVNKATNVFLICIEANF